MKRSLSLDAIRIFALLSIVRVHVSAYIVIFFPDTSGIEFILGNIFNGLSRAGVPLFVMLTGSLLLNEDKTFEVIEFYKKSLLWMVFLLIGWLLAYGVFYSVVLPSCTGGTPSIGIFLNFLLSFKESNYPHLWYMFMVVGLYLLIPVLRLFVLRKNKKYVFWIIVGCFIVQFMAQTLNIFTYDRAVDVTDIIGKFHLEIFTGYLGFVLLGWYLVNFEMEKSSRFVLYSVTVIVVICSILLVQYKIDEIPTIRDYLYSELSLPPFLFGWAMFVLFGHIFRDKYTQERLKNISNMCFGIYMIHVAYLELFTKVFLPYERNFCGIFAYILLLYSAVLLASFFTVSVIGRIPFLKRIFYLK